MDEKTRDAQNDHEAYIEFWENHLEEYYEPTDDGNGIITHSENGAPENVWVEMCSD